MTNEFTTRSKPSLRSLAALDAIVLSLAALTSCNKAPDIRAEGTADAAVRPEDLVCPKGLPGAELVRVQTKDDVVFCMDQREVTWGEYDAFLAAKKGDASGQPEVCAWNTGYEPEYYEMGPEPDYPLGKCEEKYRPTSKDQAANCLDFCDAHAYCAWAGKRLCGVLGAKTPEGGVRYTTTSGVDTPVPLTETTSACTQGGTTKFAYGDAYIGERCVSGDRVFEVDAAVPEVVDVSSRPCHGAEPPFDSIHDVGGNLSEWQNDCRGAELDDGCVTGGGGGDEGEGCESGVGYSNAARKSPAIGVRCCADPEPGRSTSR